MEHLFFEPDGTDTSTGLAYHNDVLSMDWTTVTNPFDFIPPETPWLDFPHDATPQARELLDYPTSLGWDVNQIWKGHIRGAHSDLDTLEPESVGQRVASFIQAWLYFGLLESFLGKKVEVSYLMRPNSNNRNTLYTRNLHFCLQANILHVRIKGHVRNHELQQHLAKTLLFARDWMLRLTAFGFGRFKEYLDRDYPGFMDLVSIISPAIVRLIEAIRETTMYVFNDWSLPSLANLHVPFAAVESRRARLRQSSWCDFQIALLEATTNQSTMDWLVNSGIRQHSLGHENCTPVACARNNVDVSTYRQQHCVPDCQCAPLFPDQTQVEEILKEDRLPVICVEYPDGAPQLVVQAMEKGKTGDYVAISHVWVDGLGGSVEKGLLACQTLRIHALVTKAMNVHPGPSAKFWIDSLCIPGHGSELYMAALIGIRDVYACAHLVLVIDRLVQQCLPTSSTEILLASIYMSAWMQRMWTYEEAVLARNLIFLISNDEFFEYDPRKTGPTMRHTVSVVWRTLSAQLRRFRIKEGELNIGHVYLAFRFRLTNAKGDEFLSIASMLGFKPNQMDALEGFKREERAREFWLMLKDIPADVVFIEGPKLAMAGFRWAPSTMMYPAETRIHTQLDCEKSVCKNEGLFGSYLYLGFDRNLRGCNAYTPMSQSKRLNDEDDQLCDQTFLVWVEDGPYPDDKTMLFRIYCNESWPTPPDSSPFDGVIISTTKPSAGQMWPGVALLRNEPPKPLHTTGSTSANVIPTYKYVGRAVVERLRTEELENPTRTIMYLGANNTQIQARGVLKVANLCIT